MLLVLPKNRGMLFSLKAILCDPNPQYFLPVVQSVQLPASWTFNAGRRPYSTPGLPSAWKRSKPYGEVVVKGSDTPYMRQPSSGGGFFQVRRRIHDGLICMYKIMHDLLILRTLTTILPWKHNAMFIYTDNLFLKRNFTNSDWEFATGSQTSL